MGREVSSREGRGEGIDQKDILELKSQDLMPR